MATQILNKKASFDYEYLEEFNAGVELLGHEVKSIRRGRAKLEGAHVVIRGGEAYLVGASIEPYQPLNATKSYDPARPRRLLLTKKELNKLVGLDSQKGLTLVPISLYNNDRGLFKLRFALARGKKKADKREAIKERDAQREMSRALKARNA